MDIGLFFRGFIIGLSIAAPVGPISILVLRRNLTEGRAAGLVSGLGVATADAFYGSLAGFGLTAVSIFLTDQQVWLRVIGGLFLCFLGVKFFLSQPAEQSAPVRKRGLIGAYFSTFALTLTNPMTIIAFTAIFAGLGLGSTARSYDSAILLVLGVFAGSAFWWLVLSLGAGLLRTKVTLRGLRWVNRISGVVIGGFGVYIILSVL